MMTDIDRYKAPMFPGSARSRNLVVRAGSLALCPSRVGFPSRVVVPFHIPSMFVICIGGVVAQLNWCKLRCLLQHPLWLNCPVMSLLCRLVLVPARMD